MPQIHITLTEEEHKLLKKRAKENLNPVTLEARKIIHNILFPQPGPIPIPNTPIIREPIPEYAIPKTPPPITIQHQAYAEGKSKTNTITIDGKERKTTIGEDDDTTPPRTTNLIPTPTYTPTFKSLPDKSKIPEGYTNSPFNDKTLVVNPDNPDDPELDTLIAFLDKEELDAGDDSYALYNRDKSRSL